MDETALILGAMTLIGVTLLIVTRQPWFRRLTSSSQRRTHVRRRRRRPRYRRAA